jgi:hypothetical protein
LFEGEIFLEREKTWEMGVVSSEPKLLRLILRIPSFFSSGTLYTTAPIPLNFKRSKPHEYHDLYTQKFQISMEN